MQPNYPQPGYLQPDFTKKKIILLALAIAAFILVIVAIAAVSFFASSQHPTTITNQEAASANGADLGAENYTEVGADLHALAEDEYGLTADAPITASIREASYTEKTNSDGYRQAEFLLDVDTLEVTYAVVVTIEPSGEISYLNFGCTVPSLSKYPNSFCIGSENVTSIDTTIASQLPYLHYTDGRLDYRLDYYGGATYLSLKVYTHCDDQPTHDAAVASAQTWVKAQVPELEIPIQEEDFENTCWFGVDGEI